MDDNLQGVTIVKVEVPEKPMSMQKGFLCNFCGQEFARKHNVKIHIASFHEGKKGFICLICQKPFAKRSNLKVRVQSRLEFQVDS